MFNACVVEAAEDDADDSRPEMELLEFIGEWETPDGEWFDPLDDSEKISDQEGQDDN